MNLVRIPVDGWMFAPPVDHYRRGLCGGGGVHEEADQTHDRSGTDDMFRDVARGHPAMVLDVRKERLISCSDLDQSYSGRMEGLAEGCPTLHPPVLGWKARIGSGMQDHRSRSGGTLANDHDFGADILGPYRDARVERELVQHLL